MTLWYEKKGEEQDGQLLAPLEVIYVFASFFKCKFKKSDICLVL